MGRRGETGMMYELIISLLLVALFAVATIGFITRNANGEQYFSKFYAADIATSAEVVNAGYGNVVLRYDNLKPGMELRFWNENGRVRVGTLDTAAGGGVIADYYGKAPRAKLKDFDYPTYLVLRKVEGTFAIQNAQLEIQSCPVVQPAVPLDKAIITLQAPEKAVSAFKDTLKSSPIQYATNGNIRISVVRNAGMDNAISFSPTNSDGQSYACHVLQQLERVSIIHFTSAEPQLSGKEFTLGITLTLKGDETLTDEQIGRAMALALAGYYR